MPNLRFELRGIFRIKNILISFLIATLLSGGLFFFTWINSCPGTDLMFSFRKMNTEIGNIIRFNYSNWKHAQVLSKEKNIYFDPSAKFNSPYVDSFGGIENFEPEYIKYIDEFNRQVNRLAGKVFKGKHEFPQLALDVFALYHKIKESFPRNMPLESDGFVEEWTYYFKYLVEGGFTYEDPEHSLVGTNFAKKTVLTFFGLPLALVLSVLLKGLFAREYEHNVMRFRLTQPGSRASYFFAKLLASILFSVFFMMIIVLISYIIGGLFGGEFGRWDYPAIKKSLLGGRLFRIDRLFKIVPLWSYILKSGASILSVFTLLFTMMMFMSVIIKNGNIVFLIFFVLLPGAASVSSGKFDNVWRMVFEEGASGFKFVYKNIYNPFCFLFPDKIIMIIKKYPFILLFISFSASVIFLLLTIAISKISFVQNLSLSRRPLDNLVAIGRHERSKFINKFVALRFGLLRLFKRESFFIFLTLIILGSGIFGLHSSSMHKNALNYRLKSLKYEADGNYISIYVPSQSEDSIQKSKEMRQNTGRIDLEAFQNNDTEAMAKYFIKDIRSKNITLDERTEESIRFNLRQYFEMGRRGSVLEVYDHSKSSIQPTIFSKYKNIFDFVKKKFLYSRYQPSITFNVNKLFRQYIYIILLAVLAYIGATVFGVFPVYKNKAKDGLLIRLQPIKRNRIYLAGMGTALSALLIIFSASILAPSSAILARGEGFEKNYPAVKFINDVNVDFDGHTEMVSKIAANRGDEEAEEAAGKRIFGYRYRDMGDENLEMIVLAFIAAVLALSLMSVMGAAAGILVMLAGYIISAFALKAASVYLPFVWANWYSVASGTSNVIYNSHSFNFVVGAGVMLAWFAVIVVVKTLRERSA